MAGFQAPTLLRAVGFTRLTRRTPRVLQLSHRREQPADRALQPTAEVVSEARETPEEVVSEARETPPPSSSCCVRLQGAGSRMRVWVSATYQPSGLDQPSKFQLKDR